MREILIKWQEFTKGKDDSHIYDDMHHFINDLSRSNIYDLMCYFFKHYQDEIIKRNEDEEISFGKMAELLNLSIMEMRELLLRRRDDKES